tara:strand:- start:589 stop:1008 length:420 start_codon:yes stop_codon:yes gene_type:complete
MNGTNKQGQITVESRNRFLHNKQVLEGLEKENSEIKESWLDCIADNYPGYDETELVKPPEQIKKALKKTVEDCCEKGGPGLTFYVRKNQSPSVETMMGVIQELHGNEVATRILQDAMKKTDATYTEIIFPQKPKKSRKE